MYYDCDENEMSRGKNVSNKHHDKPKNNYKHIGLGPTIREIDFALNNPKRLSRGKMYQANLVSFLNETPIFVF